MVGIGSDDLRRSVIALGLHDDEKGLPQQVLDRRS